MSLNKFFFSFFLGLSLNSFAFSLELELDPYANDAIEKQIKAKMWSFSEPCDTNQNLIIEPTGETTCVATQLGAFDADLNNSWVESEITVFVRDVMKMPLFAKAIAREIIKRFDLNQNAILEFNEVEEMVNGLEKPKD
jgi:hypothetical protein